MISSLLSFIGMLAFIAIVIGILLSLAIRPIFISLWLRKHGTPIVAIVKGFERSIDFTTHGRLEVSHAIAEWEDPQTGKVYTFKSRGGRTIKEKHPIGSNLEVLIDPRNPKRYEVIQNAAEITEKIGDY